MIPHITIGGVGVSMMDALRAIPRTGPGKRSWFSPRMYRPSSYSGAHLRKIRAQNGVGRPPRRAA